ncbi:MAG: AbrB/MazE/SpoVT family DNA-binding domain-containing protein [Armatimonadota bacterium]
MPTSTITSKGQVTIPKHVREALRVGPGDKLDFLVQDDGRVLLQPATIDVASLKGILHRKGLQPVSIQAMHTAIARRVRAKP